MVVTAVTTSLLYAKTQQLFRWSIDERMLAVASVAATKFDPDTLDRIGGPESVGSDAYEQAVRELQRIRRHTPRLRFIYILRKTDDPDTLEFVADADSLHPDVPVDLNGDGTIDESDALTYPGDPYPISSFPEFRLDAFVRPFVDPELVQDQWGTLLSGTAPIGNDDRPDEPVRYVIGLDLDVSQFEQLKNLALIPFVVFVGFLLAVITALMFIVKRMWQEQVRQLAEIDRQKDELISIVSHQLGSPVAAIRWGLEVLLDGDLGTLSDDAKKQLQDMSATATNLTELIDLLLDVSRIELGRMKMNKQKWNLAAFFREIIPVIEQKAREKGVQFMPVMPPALPEGTFDKRLTHMTIENLLTNAVKYTPAAGSVELVVEMRGNTLCCTVRDTGIGIPKKDQPQVFGKLYRASNAQRIDGNGFGLYVAKGAIEQQGGTIWFTSEEGQGTTFFVELPV